MSASRSCHYSANACLISQRKIQSPDVYFESLLRHISANSRVPVLSLSREADRSSTTKNEDFFGKRPQGKTLEGTSLKQNNTHGHMFQHYLCYFFRKLKSAKYLHPVHIPLHCNLITMWDGQCSLRDQD